ncbi:hypothetical protein J2Y38_002130 [Flavobacterium sp. 2755]|uniref:hypothetical protein n=1 Tax=Flavobacterium sp. 2755 TaxID=2817765 RepID=UPI0028545D55|nr:hypothetical protein [Flavobacterium sp. 2755]MDR6761919.1 hypothetical protein [Flavobacterium sp. 2755]
MDGINPENVTEVSSLENYSSIESGTVLGADIAADIDWAFIPFNYKQRSRKAEFILELEKAGLGVKLFDKIENITANKALIRKAYDNIEGDLNENSMILFSGKEDGRILEYTSTNKFLPFLFHPKFYKSCIYFGDLNLNEPNIVRDIKMKLKGLLATTGTIQVPHHGAINNFNKEILDSAHIECAVLSFGTTNSFGHPSSTVIGELAQSGVFSICVTEVPNSRFIQFS